jgi:hypothetical protein
VREFLRTEPIALDLAKPRRCPDASSFAGWIEATFAEILREPSHDDLDRVMLRIAQEYILRRRGIRVHHRQVCLQDVFHEWMDRLWEQQRSLMQIRIYEPPPVTAQAPQGAPVPIPALYIGQAEEQDGERGGE